MVYTLRFFPLQNAVCFIILTYLVPVLFTFYIQGVLKLKENNPGAKRLGQSERNGHPNFIFLICLFSFNVQPSPCAAGDGAHVEVQWPECSPDHPPPSSAEIVNCRAKNLFPLCAFMTCRRENVTFTFTFICSVIVKKRNAFRSKEGCFCL